jgi:hypothetical protein
MADWSVFSVIGDGLDGPHHFASVDTDARLQIDALVCLQSLGVTRISSCHQTLAIPEISDPQPINTQEICNNAGFFHSLLKAVFTISYATALAKMVPILVPCWLSYLKVVSLHYP